MKLYSRYFTIEKNKCSELIDSPELLNNIFFFYHAGRIIYLKSEKHQIKRCLLVNKILYLIFDLRLRF